MPVAHMPGIAALTAVTVSASSGLGMALYARPTAFSRKTPVGSPSASRSITPPGTSAVAAVIPARRSAALFSQMECRSLLSRATGTSGATASSSARCGRTPSVHVLACQPAPRIQADGRSAWAAARARTISATASAEAAAVTSISVARSASSMKWTWLSVKPGSSSRPVRSITSVRGPRSSARSAAVPTARKRSPRTATASAQGVRASAV